MKIKLANRKYEPKEDEVFDIDANDNQWIIQKDNELNYFSCCDCGLAHLIKIKQKKGKMYIQFERDDVLTSRNRSIKKYKIK